MFDPPATASLFHVSITMHVSGILVTAYDTQIFVQAQHLCVGLTKHLYFYPDTAKILQGTSLAYPTRQVHFLI